MNGKDDVDIRGGYPDVVNVLQGGCPVGTDFRIRGVVHVSINGKDGRRNSHKVPAKNHIQVGVAEPRGSVCDSIGGGNSVGSGDSVDCHVNWPQSGGGSPLGGVAAYF